MAFPSSPGYTYKYQKIWLNATMKTGLFIPISFKLNTSYKCNCIDSMYGHPDPTCNICYGTGYHNMQEIYNKKWVAALIAPFDAETIQRYGAGHFTKSMRMLLISYPISPEFNDLYGIESNINLVDADGTDISANLGFIVQPKDKEATIVFKEKLYTGNQWDVIDREFEVVNVESYKVSEFPIGQKLIIKEKSVESSNKRFIPEIPRD